jgi:hypothetical protein
MSTVNGKLSEPTFFQMQSREGSEETALLRNQAEVCFLTISCHHFYSHHPGSISSPSPAIVILIFTTKLDDVPTPLT